MKLTVHHQLRFSLGTPARAVQHLLLTPAATPQQKVERWSIDMPGISEAASFRDGFGNRAHLVSLVKPEGELVVSVEGAVETFDRAGVVGRLDAEPNPMLYCRPMQIADEDKALTEGLEAGGDRIATLHEMMTRLHEGEKPTQSQDVGGMSQSMNGMTQTLGNPTGEAQQGQRQSLELEKSTAALVTRFIALSRAIDIPARYVTGYALLDSDESRIHAWAEAWDDHLGWIGFDPVLNLCPIEHHIRLASGLDATATMPLRTIPNWLEMPTETVMITVDAERQ